MSPPEASHVDAEVLADLREGLLAEAEEALVLAHLPHCADCAALLEELDAVSGLLASLPRPGPMPPDVALALDNALAAALTTAPATELDAAPTAAGREHAVPRGAPSAEGIATVTALPVGAARRPRRSARPQRSPGHSPRLGWSTRWLQVAAAAVVVLALGGILVPAINGGGSDDSGGAEQASSAADESGSAAGGGEDTALLRAAPVLLATGTDYTPESLAEAAPALATEPRRLSAEGNDSAPVPEAAASSAGAEPDPDAVAPLPRGLAELAGLRDSAALESCATQLADGVPTIPLAVDLARYESEPAAIFLLPTPGDPATLDVFVVAPGCPPGEFRYFTRVNR